MSIFDADEDQVLKGALHGAALMLVILIDVYHWVRWAKTRRSKNLVCSCLYLGAAGVEVFQIRKHL